MSEIESDDCEDESCDPHQDQPTRDSVASDCPVQKTLAKTYTGSIRCTGKREQRKNSEEDATAPSQERNVVYPLSPTIVSVPYYRPDWSFGEA